MKPEVYDPIKNKLDSAIIEHKPILLLGDSHTERVRNRHLGNKIFNLANDGDSFADMYALLRSCIEQGYKPSQVVIPADYHVFSQYRATRNNEEKIISIVDQDVAKTAYSNQSVSDVFLEKYLWSLLPLLDGSKSKLVILTSFAKVKKMMNGNVGEDIREWEKVDDVSKEAQRTKRFKSHFSVIIDNQSIEGFDKLTKLIREENISVLGIRYPLDVKYREMILQKNISGVDSLFNANNISVKDYSNFFNTSTFFADQDHLNVSGAKLLGHEFQKLLN